MNTDFFGNPISVGPNLDSGRAAIDDFVVGLVSYHERIAGVLNAAAIDGAPALVLAYAGIVHLLAETTGAEAGAVPLLAAARSAATRHGVTKREAAWIEVLAAWAANDIATTIARLTALVEAFPRDLAALKLLQYHHFNRGEFPAMLRPALAVADVDPALPWLGGMLAFAYEQLHLLDEAETAARDGLALVPDDPWAQHALAHVWLTRGRIDEGLIELERWSPGWVGLNSFMVTHLWWHLAVFYLARGRYADALAIYDGHVWAHDKAYSQDQVGAVSLLARLEAVGVDVGPRWAELGEWLAVRAEDTLLPFLSVQYAYGLARAGRAEADRLVAAIARTADADAPDGVWRLAALPLARGLVAHARGDWRAAIPLLDEAVPRLAHLGGSHAQRDLFALVLLDARLRAGDWAEAQQALEPRRSGDPAAVPVNAALAKVYAALDLPRQATAARARLEPVA